MYFYPPINHTIGRKYRSREMIAPWSKVPNMVSGRTLVKSIIWSNPSRKYRIGIFGRGAAKTGKKSWREALYTTGAKFRSAGMAPCTLQSATAAGRYVIILGGCFKTFHPLLLLPC